MTVSSRSSLFLSRGAAGRAIALIAVMIGSRLMGITAVDFYGVVRV